MATRRKKTQDAPAAPASVRRVIKLLEALADIPAGFTLSELSDLFEGGDLSFGRSTISYMLRELKEAGYVRQDRRTRRYKLGLRLVSLGHLALWAVELRKASFDALVELLKNIRAKVGITDFAINLGILDETGAKVFYIERIRGPEFAGAHTELGKPMRVYATAIGKSQIAFWPEDKVERMTDKYGFEKLAKNTIATFPELRAKLREIRKRGWALDDEENYPGVRCVAVPVFAKGKRGEEPLAIAGISILSTTRNLDPSNFEKVAHFLKVAARKVAKEFDMT